MKLVEALKLINSRSSPSPEWTCFLACGFTPLHLQTFLHAHLVRRTQSSGQISTGVFGDLIGNVERAARQRPERAVVAIEWSDLDARLGHRGTHRWTAASADDMVRTVRARLRQLEAATGELGERTVLCLSLPTLRLNSMFPESPARSGAHDLWLKQAVYEFGARLAAEGRVRIVDAEELAERSPPASRHDVRSELASGFPYELSHAAILAEMAADLLCPDPTKKGLITDLDDTLWRGILGEDGVAGIHWDLDHQSHGHALYQELLGSLAELGVLIGVASKNDPRRVEEALAREDLIVPASALFPVQAGWGAKSSAVESVLAAWNVAADSVVFVDDDPLHVAEVSASFPEMECHVFPTKDDKEIVRLIRLLRHRFAKDTITEEDRIRVRSLRSSWEQRDDAVQTPDEFLEQVDSELTLRLDQPDARSLQLINKSNQFNLNGSRIDESTWTERIQDPNTFLVSASYTDKFGPLGKISVVLGRREDGVPVVDTWVMSCRAFSRRIEHQLLQALFDQLRCDALQIEFRATDRNGPMREFLTEMAGAEPSGPFLLSRAAFLQSCPRTFARLRMA